MIGLTLLAVGLLNAPPQEAAAALLADDLSFAEKLAVHRYYDVAINVVEATQDNIRRINDSNLEGEASLVRARIIKRQGENTGDQLQRLELMSEAVRLLTDWTNPGTPYAYHDRFIDALEDLAGLLRERGILYAHMAEEGEDHYAAKAERAEQVYVDLRSEAETIADQFEELEQIDQALAMRNRAVYTLYFRGLNRIEWAEVGDDPSHHLEQAETQLEDFQWEIENQTLIVFKAMYEQARVYKKLSKILTDQDEADGYASDTRDVLASVIEQVDDAYWSYVHEFPPVVQRQIAGLLDRTWGYQAQIEAEAGNMEAAEGFIDTLLSEHKEKNIPIGRAGFSSLLDWARTLEGLGRSSQATEIVKIVTDAGRNTPEGQQAEIMLAALVKGGGVQSAAVLLQAARGFRSGKHYGDAAFHYLRAATSLASEDERREIGYEAWMGAGDALARLGRHLEAAVAFEQALLLGQAQGASLDDLESAAKRLYDSYDLRFKESGDAYDRALRMGASESLRAMDGIELDLAFMSAKEAFNELADDDTQGYLAVRAEFEAVPSSSPNYEWALVYIARCLAGAARFQESVDAFLHLEARADDASLEPSNATGRNRREVAMAQAHYYHAGLLLQDELNQEVFDPAAALSVLADFEEDYAGQEGFHALVKFKRVEAHALLSSVEDVEAALKALVEFDARPSIIAPAAYKVAKTIESASRSQKGLGNAADARDLLRRAANAMWLYAEQSDFESTINMLGTGEWYLEAQQPADAQMVFEKSVEVLGQSGKASDADLTERAKIGLATALDVQMDFGRSRTIWKELHSRNPRSTKIRRGAARCYGGWLEIDDDGNIKEIRGSGDYEDALKIWTELVRGLNVQAKYTGPWWEAKLSAILAFYQMRELKPDAAASCRKVLDSIKLSQPNYDADTVRNLPPAQQYQPLYRNFFRYLDRQVPQ